jgi:3-hydroxymyristoyl/3-hydroxydecanoyl-(acyl carrier protein) dehydratase
MVAEISVPSESHWFSGHFPGEPILPGIAQLEMVFDTIKELTQKNLRISNVRKVRFKQIIRPDDSIKIIVRSQNQGFLSFSFRVIMKGHLACSGIVETKESE